MIYKNTDLQSLPNEVWKDIPDYEGYYKASNLGRIKSINRIMWIEKRKRYLPQYSTLLKPGVDKDGYLQVVLCKNFIKKYIKIHRVIALTFIPNIENYDQINHINCNKVSTNSSPPRCRLPVV